MQEPAAWKTHGGFLPFQSLLSSAQGTRVQWLFVCKWCFHRIRCYAYTESSREMCLKVQSPLWGFQGFGISLSRCFITFWWCLLGIACDLFSFSSQQFCLCTQVPGNGACPSRYLFVKCASSHPGHTWQNTIYSISPSLICEPDYIREVMNNEQGTRLSQQRKSLGVSVFLISREKKNPSLIAGTVCSIILIKCKM